MGKEKIIHSERIRVKAPLERAKPLVEKYAAVVAERDWGIPKPSLDFSLDLRERIEWEKSDEPDASKVVQSSGTFFHKENRLAINLTEFRESTARYKQYLEDFGFEKVDPQLIRSLIILAHDGVVHKNCQERQIFGKLHHFLLEVGEETLKEGGMDSVIEPLDEREGSIFLKGAAIYYHLTNGSFFWLGKMVDESFVITLTSEVVIPCLRDLYSLSWPEAIKVYEIVADPLPSWDSIKAATDFYSSQSLFFPSLFFSGFFLNHYVFKMENEKQKFEALSWLVLGQTRLFLQTIQ